jgi:ABC-type polysaccharide/polyol phosphate export permease
LALATRSSTETPADSPARARQSGRSHSVSARLRELLRYRDLIRNLVVSEVKTRYKNSVLGFVWSLLNPLAMMLVFTVVFGFLWPNQQVENFPIYLLCGLLPWNFFSASVISSVNSVVNNGNLVKKVYFPREVLPIATVLAQLVNFLLALVVLFVALFIFRTNFSPWLWTLPIIILIQTCFSLGIGLVLSTLQVFYRDTQLVMEVVMLAWFFLTPVFYRASQLPMYYKIGELEVPVQRVMYILNPMASLINVYRDLLYNGYRTDIDFFIRTAVTALLALGIGYWFFTRYSDRFGEEV